MYSFNLWKGEKKKKLYLRAQNIYELNKPVAVNLLNFLNNFNALLNNESFVSLQWEKIIRFILFQLKVKLVTIEPEEGKMHACPRVAAPVNYTWSLPAQSFHWQLFFSHPSNAIVVILLADNLLVAFVKNSSIFPCSCFSCVKKTTCKPSIYCIHNSCLWLCCEGYTQWWPLQGIYSKRMYNIIINTYLGLIRRFVFSKLDRLVYTNEGSRQRYAKFCMACVSVLGPWACGQWPLTPEHSVMASEIQKSTCGHLRPQWTLWSWRSQAWLLGGTG